MKLAAYLSMWLLGLVSLFSVIPNAFAQEAPSVASVTFHSDGTGTEKVRIKLIGAHSPKVYSYNGEKPRLICDFPGAGYSAVVKPVIQDGNTLVKGIRIGVHNPPEKKVRIVLDLEPGRKYTFNQDFSKAENILNILLVPAGNGGKAGAGAAKIAATEVKQVVISGPKKVMHPPQAKEQKEPEEKQTPVETVPAAEPAPDKAAGLADKDQAVPVPPAQSDKPAQPATAAAESSPAAAVTEPPAKPAQSAVEPAAVESSPAAAVTELPAKPAQSAVEPAAAEKAAVTPPAKEEEKKAVADTTTPEEKAAAPAVDQEKAPASTAQTADPNAPAPLLLDITYENSSSKGEMIFFKLNGFFPPNISAIESDTPQVICEFTGMTQKDEVRPVIEARGAYVQKIVATPDKGSKKIKVVIELTAGRDYDLRQVFFKEDNLFVMIVNALDEKEAGAGAEGAAAK